MPVPGPRCASDSGPEPSRTVGSQPAPYLSSLSSLILLSFGRKGKKICSSALRHMDAPLLRQLKRMHEDLLQHYDCTNQPAAAQQAPPSGAGGSAAANAGANPQPQAAGPRHHINPLAKCGCKKHCIDFHGDHTSTCTAHSGATKAHGSKNHRIQGSRLQYMRDQAGSRSLVFDLSTTHDRDGSSSHVQQNGLLSHPQDLDARLRLAAQRKMNGYRQQFADNHNTSFLPAVVSTSTRMHGKFFASSFSTGPAGDRGALHCHWSAIATQPIGLVPFQARGILPVAEEQSQTCGGQSGGVEDQPQFRGLWHCSSPIARSLSRSPSSPPPSFTQSPSPPR